MEQAKQKMKRSSKVKPEPAQTAPDSRSLAKGVQILEMLAERESALGLSEIAAVVGLGKASTLRLLRTLAGMGYLTRDEADNYRLERAWPSRERDTRLRRLRESAAPLLEKLRGELGETVAMAFLFDDVIRVVDVIESTHHIRMSNYRGGVLQPYASSLGKSITAFQSPELAQRLLYTYGIFSLTPHTRTDFRAIHDDLAQVRHRGFAWDREETVPGGICVGAPIRFPASEVHAAVSMSTPVARFTRQLEELLPGVVKDYAAEISKALRRP